MIVRGVSLVLATVLATGCAQLFGLDTPSLVDAPDDAGDTDTDLDGIVDASDNCPTVANPDQRDIDDNKIGDRCEGCVMLPLRLADDDDGDGVPDATDTCIGKSGGTSDADMDGIGDACDPRVGPDTRFCVWTFRDPQGSEPAGFWDSAWDLPGGRWEFKDSMLVHEPSSAVEIASVHDGYIEGPGGVALDTKLAASGFGPTMVLGAELELQTSGPPMVVACRLTRKDGMNPALELVRDDSIVDAVAIPIALPPSIGAFARLVVIKGASELSVRCTIEGNLLPSTTLVDTVMTAIPVQARARVFASDAMVSWDHVAAHKLGL